MGVQQTIADATKVYKIAYVHRESLIIYTSGHSFKTLLIILFATLFALLECVS